MRAVGVFVIPSLLAAAAACGDNRKGAAADARSSDTGVAVASVTGIAHTAADLFTITFDGPTRDHLSVDITTTPAAYWTVVETARTSPTTWTVRLSDYPLPVDQAWVVTQLDDSNTSVATDHVTVSGSDIHTRVAFVSKAIGDGNILGWAELPAGSTASTGVEAADDICQAEADAAGLKGTFRALITTNGSDLQCRLAGLSGDFAADCGGATIPSLGPWMSMVGVPIVEGLDAMATNAWTTMVRHTPDQNVIAHAATVWLGADADGNADGDDCGAWTSPTSAGGGSWFDAGDRIPLTSVPGGPSISSCDHTRQLMCFQADAGGFPFTDAHKKVGKLVFVTSALYDGAPSPDGGTTVGVPAVDATCQAHADSAGLNPGGNRTFRGYVSTSSDDAMCRVLGFSGKVADNCGQQAASGGPWVRMDGIVVADSVASFTGDALLQPVLLTETGARSTTSPWTGSNNGVATGVDCSGWNDNMNAEASIAFAPDLVGWGVGGQALCYAMHPFYCFEQ